MHLYVCTYILSVIIVPINKRPKILMHMQSLNCRGSKIPLKVI